MNPSYWLNSVWMWKCRGEASAFRQATRAVADTQAAVLRQILANNWQTEFGITHGFATVQRPADYQHRVPLTTFDFYRESIQEIAAGRTNVLTAERVRLLEPTSGTTGGEKLIPYTSSLRRQFQRALAAWIADLMQHRPMVRFGRAYWSISPAPRTRRRSAGGIPIGFENDTAYLGPFEQWTVNKLLSVPSAVAALPDIENFRYCTLLHLLRADDLALISIWSPTFLTALLRPLDRWSDRICFDLRRGTLSLPNPIRGEIPKQLFPRHTTDIRRAAQLEQVLASPSSWAEKLKRIWPALALISCWADAAASRFLPELQQLFPSVEIQPKGLLATEGCVSFPLVDRPGAALALRSHFFEFGEADGLRMSNDASRLRLAHELDRGGTYQVIVTTAGGLYRYQLGDVVQVVGFENQCPLLRFLGRCDRVSDLVGEKLSEPHVRDVLDRAFAHHGISPRFAMIVPIDKAVPHYRLYVQASDADGMKTPVSALTSSIQVGLEQNPYYRHAVALGQLAPLDVCVLDGSGISAWAVYEQESIARGQKPGNVKPTSLDTWSGWPSRFDKLADIPALQT